MKKTYYLFGVFILCIMMGCNEKTNTEKNFIEENITFAENQTRLMLAATGKPDGKNYPRTIGRKGNFVTTGIHDWTPGFFPGSLWYLYELTGDEAWKEEAEQWTYPLEPQQYFTGNHDVGFMMYCSYGNAQRLAPKEGYKEILVQSAHSLCTRYNETVKSIESWDYRKAWDGTEWFFPVIIDNMMNLELLFYAWRETNDPYFYDVAVNHANTTLKYHFREDHSSYHVVDYDTITGLPLHRQTCQGYSDNSTWSRGQAWAVYGYTLMFRETGDSVYLDAARNFADYYIKHLPDDLVPYWDFNVGQEGFTPDGDSYAVQSQEKPRDASASAIVCSALFELNEYTKDNYYGDIAVKMLKSLASPTYRAGLGTNTNFIIQHCTGSFPHRVEIDVPLVYADYYFLEALVRYKKINEL